MQNANIRKTWKKNVCMHTFIAAECKLSGTYLVLNGGPQQLV